MEFAFFFKYYLHNNIGNCIDTYMLEEEGIGILNLLLTKSPQLLLFTSSYASKGMCTIYGSILRECFHYDVLLAYYLIHLNKLLTLLIKYAHHDNETMQTDVLYTLQELLLNHRECGEPPYVDRILAGFDALLDTKYVNVQVGGLEVVVVDDC